MQVVIQVTSSGYSDRVNRHSTFFPDRARAIFDGLSSKGFNASSSSEGERKQGNYNFRAITRSETLATQVTFITWHCLPSLPSESPPEQPLIEYSSERRDCLTVGRAKVVPSFLSYFKTHRRPPALQSSALPSAELTYTSSLQINVKWFNLQVWGNVNAMINILFCSRMWKLFLQIHKLNDGGCLPFTKRKWNMFFWAVPAENCRNQWNIWKGSHVSLVGIFKTEIPVLFL